MALPDIGLTVFTVILIIQSYWDLRYKEIPFLVTLITAVVGLLISICVQRDWIDMLSAIFPGIVCLGIGKVTRQAIGYGDGFLLLTMGLYISCREVLSVGMTAIMISGVVALVLLVYKKKKGKDQLPFVPFFLIAWVIYILSEKGVVL